MHSSLLKSWFVGADLCVCLWVFATKKESSHCERACEHGNLIKCVPKPATRENKPQ